MVTGSGDCHPIGRKKSPVRVISPDWVARFM